jgi:hypothetical protein
MVEMFGVYALLLAGWGLWKAHAGSSDSAPDDAASVAAPVAPTAAHERGAAARRHLRTLP